MISEIDKFNRIKDELISSYLELNLRNSLNQICANHPEITSDIKELQESFGLCNLEYYEDEGLAFRFDCDTNKPICNYYMLYTLDPEDRDEFAEYEQFVDYRVKRWDYDSHWTFIKLVYSYD